MRAGGTWTPRCRLFCLRFPTARRAGRRDGLQPARRRQTTAAGALPGRLRGGRRRSCDDDADRVCDRNDPHLFVDSRRPSGDGQRCSPSRPADAARRRGARARRFSRATVCSTLAFNLMAGEPWSPEPGVPGQQARCDPPDRRGRQAPRDGRRPGDRSLPASRLIRRAGCRRRSMLTALRRMHGKKTGALIRASATAGAMLAEARLHWSARSTQAAGEFGLAFQIVDDILDVEGASADLGKTAGKDAAAGKPTYPALFGLETSKRMAADCLARAGDRARHGQSRRQPSYGHRPVDCRKTKLTN